MGGFCMQANDAAENSNSRMKKCEHRFKIKWWWWQLGTWCVCVCVFQYWDQRAFITTTFRWSIHAPISSLCVRFERRGCWAYSLALNLDYLLESIIHLPFVSSSGQGPQQHHPTTTTTTNNHLSKSMMMMKCVYIEKAFILDRNFILWYSASHRNCMTHTHKQRKCHGHLFG